MSNRTGNDEMLTITTTRNPTDVKNCLERGYWLMLEFKFFAVEEIRKRSWKVLIWSLYVTSGMREHQFCIHFCLQLVSTREQKTRLGLEVLLRRDRSSWSRKMQKWVRPLPKWVSFSKVSQSRYVQASINLSVCIAFCHIWAWFTWVHCPCPSSSFYHPNFPNLSNRIVHAISFDGSSLFPSKDDFPVSVCHAVKLVFQLG